MAIFRHLAETRPKLFWTVSKESNRIMDSLRLIQIEPAEVIETTTDYIYNGATAGSNNTSAMTSSNKSPTSYRRTGLLQLGLVDGDLASTGRKVLSYHLQGVQRLLPLLYQAVYLAIVASNCV